MHRVLPFLFKSAGYFVLFVFKNICIFMQKTHDNFVSKEQTLASLLPCCGAMPMSHHTAGQPLCPALFKRTTPKNQNYSQFLTPRLKKDTPELEKV